MKIQISIDLEDVLKKPVVEWDKNDEAAIDTAQSKLPRKKDEVVLGPKETQITPAADNKPLEHIVKEGETLKQIAEKYSVSYGELSNHLLNNEGTTSIYAGQKIRIPRHFIDLSKANG